MREFVRDRQPDADTLAAIADEVGEDVAKIEAWFVDRSSHLPAETAAHLSMLGAGPSDMDPGSPGSSLDGDSRVSSSAIRSWITQALKSLDPPEFVPRGALWDLVNVDNNFTNKQVGPSSRMKPKSFFTFGRGICISEVLGVQKEKTHSRGFGSCSLDRLFKERTLAITRWLFVGRKVMALGSTVCG